MANDAAEEGKTKPVKQKKRRQSLDRPTKKLKKK
jgi:hypothetical protein